MNDLQFDQHIFAGRRHLPVEAEYTQNGWSSNGVSHEDYSRMQTQNSSVSRRCKRWTPAFAGSSDKLRRVLLERGRLYLSSGHSAGHSASDWRTINAAATKKALAGFDYQNCPEHKRRENEAHVAAVKRAGGYLEWQGAIAYRAWRLGQDSVAVGESLGMSPSSVRQNLVRLCDVARDLGFETFPHHHTFRDARGARKAARKQAAEAQKAAREAKRKALK